MPGPERLPGLRAELVAIGTELLRGDSIDTNSVWLSRRFVELGIDVDRHTTVGDRTEDIVEALRRAVGAHDVVVTTGGLGPTQDDRTRQAVARLAGVRLERHDDLADRIRTYFAQRGRDMPARNLVQADLPAGGRVIPPVGTAPGFALEVGDALVVCLPGVPREMQQMVDDHVLGLLQERGGLQATVTRVVRTAGIAESAVADRLADLDARLEAAGDVELAYLAARAETRVRVTARASDRATAAALVDPVVDEVVARLGPAVVGVDAEGVEHAIARQLLRRSWTLAVAESITGGGLGARLVTVAGASRWFAGGVIAYATPAKTVLADVAGSQLAAHGPVSEPVARALAEGVRRRLDVDVGLGVVGVAGPDPQGGRPVGTVCVGVALPGGVHSRTVELAPRPREDLQEFAASVALEYLRRRLVAARTTSDGRVTSSPAR